MAIQPRHYETLYLIRPDISLEDLTIIRDKVTKAISSGEGEITRDEKWAERDLAYPIDDFTRGIYYIVEFKALPKVVSGIEKHLAFHNTDVLRFMTVYVEEPSTKTAEAPSPGKPKASAPRESTPAPEKPVQDSPVASPVASAPDESTPHESSALETTVDSETPPASSEDTSTASGTSGFTAAPPLSTTDKKESGGEE